MRNENVHTQYLLAILDIRQLSTDVVHSIEVK